MAISRTDLNIIIDALLPVLGSPGTTLGADGLWAVGTAYVTDNSVYHNGAVYRCITGHTGEEPPTDKWTTVSVRRPRGRITFDSATLRLPAPGIADGLLVGSAFGIPIYRSDALEDGKYAYHDEAGNLLATNV